MRKLVSFNMVAAFLLTMGLAAGISSPLIAQSGSISGRVTDASSGETLVGVNVIVDDLFVGTSTDAKGEYTIENVPVGSYTVTAYFIGYAASTVSADVTDSETTALDFELQFSIQDMDELVVTATGVRRKVEIGNAIARVDAVEAVKIRPVRSFSELLEGQATGVQVLQSGGSVGMGSRIRIRGSNSASLSNEPVIYLDGVLINNSPNSISFETGGQSPSRLDDINPNDIESIEIIKGPSAATLYGSIAANGVIRITTKRGQIGKPRWSTYLETGAVNDIGGYPENFQALTSGGEPCFTFEAAEGTCSQSTINSFQPLNDSRTSPFRTGASYGGGLSVSGGSRGLTYFLSGNYSDAAGVVQVSNLTRASFRGNFTSQLRNNLKVSLATGYVVNDMELPLNDNYALGLMGQGLNGMASPDVNDGWGEFTPAELFTIQTKQNIDRFTTGLEVDWKPFTRLNLRLSGGRDFTSRWDNQFFPTGEAPAFLNFDKGARFSNRFSEAVNTIDLVGTYNMKLSESFKSRTSIGGQYLGVIFQGTSSTGLLIVAGSSSIAGAAQTTSVESTTERRTVGVFIEEQINFREKLFLTAAVRSDRGSAFGASLESVFYPKVSASWLVSNESFFNSEGLVSSLRLRGAWGDSGVQPGTNDAIRFFTPIAATVDGGQSVTGVTFGGVGNADLKAERSREIELGVDATMFSNRLGIELTYFNKNTQDALVFRQLPLSLGVGAGRFENLGSVKNTGLEVGLNMRIVNSSKASFDLDFTGTFIDTELTELGEGIEPVIFNQVQRHTEGFPLGGYWDKPFTFSDANGDGLIAKDEVQVGDEAVYLGTPFAPTDLFFTGNLGLFGDKLVVRALLNYRGGQTLYNNTGAWRNGNSNTDELNDPSTPLEDQARAIASKFFGTNAGYIEDASFWRLREISLTYFFPEKMLTSAGLSRLSLTLSGQNVAVFTSYTGLDPEISSTGQSNFDAEEFLSQPPVRAWKARLNMSF